MAVLPRPTPRRVRGPHATLERAIIRAGSAVWRRTAEPFSPIATHPTYHHEVPLADRRESCAHRRRHARGYRRVVRPGMPTAARSAPGHDARRAPSPRSALLPVARGDAASARRPTQEALTQPRSPRRCRRRGHRRCRRACDERSPPRQPQRRLRRRAGGGTGPVDEAERVAWKRPSPIWGSGMRSMRSALSGATGSKSPASTAGRCCGRGPVARRERRQPGVRSDARPRRRYGFRTRAVRLARLQPLGPRPGHADHPIGPDLRAPPLRVADRRDGRRRSPTRFGDTGFSFTSRSRPATS